MRRVGSKLLAAGLLVGVAACSKPERIVLRPQQPMAPAVTDTRYRGTARLVHAEDRFCPRSGPRVYEVQNGAVTLSYQGAGRSRVPLTAQIQSDGTFQATDGEGRLEGRLSGGTLEMTIASRSCEHRWTMHPIP